METDDTQINFRVSFPKNVITLPAWMGVCLAVTAILSAVALLTVLLVVSGRIEAQTKSIEDQTKEMRIFQFHLEDVESVIIRSGIAKRDELAPWTAPVHAPAPRRKGQ